jgi:hypothetical protein
LSVFTLLIEGFPQEMFVDDADQLAFALHPEPTSTDVLAILDRIAGRIARRDLRQCRGSIEPGRAMNATATTGWPAVGSSTGTAKTGPWRIAGSYAKNARSANAR